MTGMPSVRRYKDANHVNFSTWSSGLHAWRDEDFRGDEGREIRCRSLEAARKQTWPYTGVRRARVYEDERDEKATAMHGRGIKTREHRNAMGTQTQEQQCTGNREHNRHGG